MSARVLIVDDDRFFASALRTQLASLGVDAFHALTGAEAIDFSYAHHPDLLIVDLELGPGLDGLATAASIRARIDVAVIYVARLETRASARQRAEADLGYLLERPFGVDPLLAAIEAICPCALPYVHDESRRARHTLHTRA